MFEVTYLLTATGIVDMRFFDELADVTEWFQRQKLIEPVIIINLEFTPAP